MDEASFLQSHPPAVQQSLNLSNQTACIPASTDISPSIPTILSTGHVASSHQAVVSSGIQPHSTSQSNIHLVHVNSQQQPVSPVLSSGGSSRIQKIGIKQRRQSITTEYTVFIKFRAMTVLSLCVLFPPTLLNVLELMLGEEMPVEFNFVCTVVVSLYPLFNGRQFHRMEAS